MMTGNGVGIGIGFIRRNLGSVATDTVAPTTPTAFSATPASDTQVNLAWTASTDDVGVTAYLIERCTGAACVDFTQVNATAGTSHNDTGLASSTTYRYRIRASDAGLNLSGYSTIAAATTPDTTAPSAPGSLVATPISNTQVDLSWTVSTDAVGVTSYSVERCTGAGCVNFAQIATPAASVYSDTGRAESTLYRYRVAARDAATNQSAYSAIASATTLDMTAPTVPSGLTATPASASQINVAWTASTDAVGVTGYMLERCTGAGCVDFGQIATPPSNAYSDTGRADGTTYRYRVRATDAAANISGYSSIAAGTTPDTTAPTAPTTLAAQAVSATQINLSWAAATDAVGVTGYKLERCTGAGCVNFTEIATPTGLTYPDTGRLDSTVYRYRVRATDAANNLSGYTNIASATTPDATAPTAPSTLTATTASATQIDLSWLASTDDIGVTGYLVERCTGAGCVNFGQIATPVGTTYSDTGRTDGTTYRYRVAASDTASNISGYSNIATATTTDATAPTAPTSLTATPASATRVDLAWVASTDAVGVTGYTVERCTGAGCVDFAQIATPTGTSYPDTGRTESTTYRYRVAATDAANNVSGYSSIAAASTPAAPDTTAPTAPTGLSATPTSQSAVTLIWSASTDAVGVTGYRIERCTGVSCSTFAQIGTGPSSPTTYGDTGLSASTSYTYRVLAVDAATNVSAPSAAATAVTQAVPDVTPPGQVVGLTATPISEVQINLAWTAATDNVAVTGYRVERCAGVSCSNFADIAAPAGTSYNDAACSAGVSYSYRVRAVDAAVNLGTYSAVATAVALDATAPTVPTGLTATPTSYSTVSLAWTASTDNIGVTGYRVERCMGASCSDFTQIATPATNSYGDTGLTGSTSYSYRVRAVDAATNISGPSAASTAVTPAAPDVTAPGQVTGLTATPVSEVQIDLAWAAATDNVGVTGYSVERCTGVSCSSFAEIATPAGTTHSDTGRNAGVSYTYKVRAYDAAANPGAYSATATAVALDTTAPSQVTGLTATPFSATQVDLSWTAATDNVGVTGYRVERCTGAGCSNFSQVATPAGTSYSDTGRTANTSYTYQVRAADASSNLGMYSAAATAVTPAAADDVILRLKMDSAVNSSVFVEEKGHTVTTVGFVTASSIQSKFGGNVAAFNGWNGRLVISDAADLTLAGDFCFEGWAYVCAAANNQTLITLAGGNWRVYRQSAGTLRLWTGAADVITGATTINPGAWFHWAWSRAAGVNTLYLNGTAQGSTYSNATTIDPTSIILGAYSTPADFLGGYLDEVQLRSSAVYTGNFTPPTASFGTDPTAAPSPADLFKLGEQGAWYDISDLATLSQDNLGATPVTTVNVPVGRILDKSGRGNHLVQATAGARPSLSASRNWVTNTNLLSAAAWTKTNLTAALSGTDPAGGATSFRLTETATATVTHTLAQSATFITGVSGGQVTLSVYAKAAERTSIILQSDLAGWNTASARFNLTTGAVDASSGGAGNATITDAGNGWWRCSIVATANAAWAAGVNLKLMLWNGTTSTYTGSTSSGILVAWPQLNPGATLLRYQRWGNAQPDYDIAGFPLFVGLDGTDDGFATSSTIDFTATDKMSIWLANSKNNDTAQRVILELGANITTTNGSFCVQAPGTAAVQNYSFQTRGTTVVANVDMTPYPGPRFEASLSCQFDNGSATATVSPRVSGVAGTPAGFSTAGNFAAGALNVGKRAAGTLPYSGNLYSVIVRAGLSSGQQVSDIETWVANKSRS